MRYFVTGGAGFIGSNLVDRLLDIGHEVIVYDNFSTGLKRFLEKAQSFSTFSLVEGDTLDLPALIDAMSGVDFVVHLAANADVRSGTQYPRKDLEQNTIATFNVLESMRLNNIKRLAFSSTGSIYGEPDIFPTPEDAPLPRQTSLYGASKLAGESLIEAYSEGFGFQVYIFRFVSILGERYTHGHIFDFYKALLHDPTHLQVLGDGHQRKSYLYVQDCIDAILTVIERSRDKINIFNLGTNEYCEINQSIDWITSYLGVNPKRLYTGGERGWVGDSPFIFLDIAWIRKLGWEPRYTIQESVIKTVQFLAANEWVLKRQ